MEYLDTWSDFYSYAYNVLGYDHDHAKDFANYYWTE